MTKSPREKFEICSKISSYFVRPLGVNLFDPNYKLFWGSYYIAVYTSSIVLCFVYDMFFRWEYKIMEVLPLVTLAGIGIPVSYNF